MDHSSAEQSIFLAALEKNSGGDREAYLDQACGDNARLRAEIEALLAANEKSGDLLDAGAIGCVPTVDSPRVAEGPGAQIGRYKLLQEIGEGGMGVVFMAEQREPVKRRVALKIIKPGMDTRQVIARFEAERQALALLDHPNIAKVLDAGSTDSGRPYFVMELVNGIPLTDYCDEHHLALEERLKLFMPICHAVQHSHQKGIIHRDLKPSNVLITEYDHDVVPKVIDFGVAKATNQTLTDKTMFTQFGQIVGTMEYMSPEQAKRNQLDIDTRSDIYSLGVMLYELLTGDTPFDRQRLRSSAFDEMLRIIREEEPPRPSTRLCTSPTLESVAANRMTAPARLTGSVRGELDWIVMRSLEKDRSRRYASAVAFAEDLDRYLSGHTITACPPSLAYRFQKFAKRNRMAFISAALLLAILSFGLVGTTWQAIRATRLEKAALVALERAEVEHKRVKEGELQVRTRLDQLRSEIRHKALVCAMNADESATEEAIEQAKTVGVPLGWEHAIRGMLYVSAGKPSSAVEHLELARQEDADDVLVYVLRDLTTIYLKSSVTEILEMSQRWRELEPDSPESQLLLALVFLYLGENEQAQSVSTKYLEKNNNGVGRRIRAEALTHLGAGSSDIELLKRAERDSIVAIELMPNSAMAYFTGIHVHSLGYHLATADGDADEAGRHLKAAEQLCRQIDQFELPQVHAIAAGFLDDKGETEAAAARWKRAHELGASGYQLGSYACFLRRHRDVYGEEFRRVLHDLEDGDEWAQCHRIILGLDEPGLIHRPCAELHRFASGDSLYGKMWPLRMLFLLGREDLGRPIAKQCLSERDDGRPWKKIVELECLADEKSPDWLLARDFDTPKGKFFAHATAAMKLIGDGDRERGIDVLRDIAKKPFGGPFKEFLATILELLEEDDSWPNIEFADQ